VAVTVWMLCGSPCLSPHFEPLSPQLLALSTSTGQPFRLLFSIASRFNKLPQKNT
jgi:hypothetical protein